jgi:hypothetical protein
LGGSRPSILREQLVAGLRAILAAMPGTIEVAIRDGRAGREGGPAGATTEGHGAILEVIDRSTPVQTGEVLTLKDCVSVSVIGIDDRIPPGRSWE